VAYNSQNAEYKRKLMVADKEDEFSQQADQMILATDRWIIGEPIGFW